MSDASKYELVITASDLSMLLGHHQFTCHIDETHPDGTVVHGVPEVWGIEWRALQSRFGGDINQWRDWVQSQMLERHQARMSVHQEILKWQGTRVEIATQPVPQSASQPWHKHKRKRWQKHGKK